MQSKQLITLDKNGFIASRLISGKWKLTHKDDAVGYVTKRGIHREFATFDAILNALKMAGVKGQIKPTINM